MKQSIFNREAVLVVSLKNKDRQAFHYLYQNYAPALEGAIRNIIQLNTLAEEVLQDAFMRIWEQITLYDPQKGRLFTWMMRLCKNLAIDKLRSKEFRKQHQNIFTLENPALGLAYQNYYELNPETIGLSEILKDLPEEQAILFQLIYFKGYTQAEVAEELNMPLGTVKTRVRAGLHLLRKKFSQV
jgi:RNA polymerase sigma factor (sigma-70 family)